jgi:hypothetical protein
VNSNTLQKIINERFCYFFCFYYFSFVFSFHVCRMLIQKTQCTNDLIRQARNAYRSLTFELRRYRGANKPQFLEVFFFFCLLSCCFHPTMNTCSFKQIQRQEAHDKRIEELINRLNWAKSTNTANGGAVASGTTVVGTATSSTPANARIQLLGNCFVVIVVTLSFFLCYICCIFSYVAPLSIRFFCLFRLCVCAILSSCVFL